MARLWNEIALPMDSADKSTNKAMSAAYKYAAFQTFCIPVEGTPDADADTPEVSPVEGQNQKAWGNAKPPPAATSPPQSPNRVSLHHRLQSQSITLPGFTKSSRGFVRSSKQTPGRETTSRLTIAIIDMISSLVPRVCLTIS